MAAIDRVRRGASRFFPHSAGGWSIGSLASVGVFAFIVMTIGCGDPAATRVGESQSRERVMAGGENQGSLRARYAATRVSPATRPVPKRPLTTPMRPQALERRQLL